MRRLAPLALAAALALPLAGCGGGNETQEGQGGTTREEAADRPPVEVILAEFSVPAEVPLSSAGRYTFLVRNEGTITHAFEIEGHGIEEASDEIGPGESTEMTVDLDEGEYETYCPVGDHRDRGMEGTLVVGAGGGGTQTETGETETGGGPGY